MSFPVATEAPPAEPEPDETPARDLPEVPSRFRIPSTDGVQQFFVDWEVPQAS